MRFWVEIAIAFLLTALIAGVAHASDDRVIQSVLVCPGAGNSQPVNAASSAVRKHPIGYRYFGTPSPSLVRHLKRHYSSMNRAPTFTGVRGCFVRYYVVQEKAQNR